MPRFSTAIVGREQEIAELTSLVGRARFTVLTGPAGVGKTRLIAAVTELVVERFGGGIFVVDMDGARTPTEVSRRIAPVVGMRDADPVDHRALEAVLNGRAALLVLENCEGLDDDSLTMLHEMQAHVAELAVLAISRRLFNVPGSYVYTLAPLSMPAADGSIRLDPARLAEHGPVTLFVERARHVQPRFELTEETARLVHELCEMLDGLPLAIELAASWMRVLSLDDLVDHVRRSPTFPNAGTGTFDERHRKLETVVASTYDMCSAEEQLLWARLTVFAGTFDLKAVESVCSAPPLAVSDVLETLLALVDRSVVTVDTSGETSRYRMLRIARALRTGLTDEREAAAERHRCYYAGAVESTVGGWLGPDQLATARKLRVDYPNIVRALEHGLDEPDTAHATTRMVVGLWATWFASGRLRHGRDLVHRVLDSPSRGAPPGERALVALVGTFLAVLQGDLIGARELRRVAEDVLDKEPHALARAFSHHVDALIEMCGLDLLAAERLLDAAMDSYACIDDPMARAFAMDAMGLATTAAAMRGDSRRARELGAAGLEICRAHGDVVWTAYVEFGLAVDALLTDDLSSARAHAIEAATSTHDELVVSHAIELLAWCEARAGRFDSAARTLGAAGRRWDLLGGPFSGFAAISRLHDECVAACRAALGAVDYEHSIVAGAAMSIGDVVTAAGDGRSRLHLPAHKFGPLTRREAEVARLLAKGESNRAIAETLHISTRTAESHVDHILTKLQLPNRTRIAAWLLSRSADTDS